MVSSARPLCCHTLARVSLVPLLLLLLTSPLLWLLHPLAHSPHPLSPNLLSCIFCLLSCKQAVDEIAVYTEVSTQSVADAQVKLEKPRVVVLGSGWASACFFKALPKDIK